MQLEWKPVTIKSGDLENTDDLSVDGTTKSSSLPPMSFISYKEFCVTNVIKLLDGIKFLQGNEP
jgi:hypothetical protein